VTYPSQTPEARRAYNQAYYAANRKRLIAETAEHARQNRERSNAHKAAWKKRNREKVAARKRERYATDIEFFLKVRVRRRVYAALKAQNVRNRAKADLGCTASELKEHLERQFTDGMSWENRHLWHVDHIRPIASFNLADKVQFRAACHFSNLQPLWAKDNQKKGASL